MLVKGLCALLVVLTSTSLLVTACSRSKSGKVTNLSPRVVALGQPVPKGGGRYKVGSPYQINGRWYRPRKNASYDRVGVASWYGELFHGRYTANGEIYDMDALTAAHPTLPMPVYVRVTNLQNGRSLVVRVNDRGPYAHDRIIDMSRRAAKLLGFQRQGTTRVRVTYLKDAPISGDDSFERHALAQEPWMRVAKARRKRTPKGAPDPVTVASVTPARPGSPAEPLYFVQAASFRDAADAEKVRRNLVPLGTTAVFPAEIDGVVWYRVRVGPYRQKATAEEVRQRLAHGGNREARVVRN